MFQVLKTCSFKLKKYRKIKILYLDPAAACLCLFVSVREKNVP